MRRRKGKGYAPQNLWASEKWGPGKRLLAHLPLPSSIAPTQSPTPDTLLHPLTPTSSLPVIPPTRALW